MLKKYCCAVTLTAAVFVSGCRAGGTGMENMMVGLGEEIEVQADTMEGRDLLASFTTEFSSGSKGRSNNIALAAKSIDGTVVQPGATFSYNETIGPTTKENGYKLARIFKNGKDAEGYGGGVCQVSSTLYNAVLQAGLEVTERHPHSKPVSYVEKGKDAATSYGVTDFKFVNNKAWPIIIRSSVTDNQISVYLENIVQPEDSAVPGSEAAVSSENQLVWPS